MANHPRQSIAWRTRIVACGTVLCAFIGSAEAKNAIKKIADELSSNAKLAVIVEEAVHVHPVCADRLDGGESGRTEMEAMLVDKLKKALREDDNRSKHIQFVAVPHADVPADRSKTTQVSKAAADRGATHLLMGKAAIVYRDNFDGTFVRDAVVWDLRLVGLVDNSLVHEKGRVEDWNVFSPTVMTVQCPVHDNGSAPATAAASGLPSQPTTAAAPGHQATAAGIQTSDGSFGATLVPITPDVKALLGLYGSNGAVIQQVLPGGPADAAGLRKFDIIIAVNYVQVTTPQDVWENLSKAPPGTLVHLGVARGKETIFPTVTLGERGSQSGVGSPPGQGAGPYPSTTSGTSSRGPQSMPGGTGLAGLYVGTEYRFGSTAGKTIIVDKYLYFLPAGGVYRDIPPGGNLEYFDMTRAAKTDPSKCGQYQIAANQISFRWNAGGGGEVAEFVNEGGRIRIGRTILYRVQTFDNLRLHSRYGRSGYTEFNPYDTDSGGVATEGIIEFTPDGRFRDSGAVAGPVMGEGSGTGRYSIRSNTLTLEYQDGHREQRTFFVHPESIGESPPRLIVIDGTKFTLVGG